MCAEALCRKALLFLLGGTGYVALELWYRGRSHVAMFAAGGVCFLLLGWLERRRLPLLLRGITGAGMITAVELLVGLAFNRDYAIWDYRALPGNFCGQICPQFSAVWLPLSLAAGAAYRALEPVYSQSQRRNTDSH